MKCFSKYVGYLVPFQKNLVVKQFSFNIDSFSCNPHFYFCSFSFISPSDSFSIFLFSLITFHLLLLLNIFLPPVFFPCFVSVSSLRFISIAHFLPLLSYLFLSSLLPFFSFPSLIFFSFFYLQTPLLFCLSSPPPPHVPIFLLA